jgi:hypothetical protein
VTRSAAAQAVMSLAKGSWDADEGNADLHRW